jgi:transcriptional regulator with XRE-family HTH domain
MLTTMADTPELLAFARRLNELCDEKQIPPKYHGRQQALADLFGVSQKGARKWLEGEAFPDWEKLLRICDWAGVRLDWLMRGKHPKRDADAAYSTDPTIAHVVDRLRAMEPEQKYLAKRLIDSIPNPVAEPQDVPEAGRRRG